MLKWKSDHDCRMKKKEKYTLKSYSCKVEGKRKEKKVWRTLKQYCWKETNIDMGNKKKEFSRISKQSEGKK